MTTKGEPRKTRNASRPAMKKAEVPAALPADAPGAAPPTEELVTCFMSGRVVPRGEAVLVKLGPGRRVWMLPEFCNDEQRDRRSG